MGCDFRRAGIGTDEAGCGYFEMRTYSRYPYLEEEERKILIEDIIKRVRGYGG